MAERAIEDAAILAIDTVTTGFGEQHAEHRYGTSKPLMWWVLTSKSWVRIPLNAYVIEHREGLVLFDAGMDPAVVLDPNYIDSPIGRFLLHRIFRFHAGANDNLGSRLNAIGYSPADVSKVLISHLHFDHVGGIADVPQAELLVNEREWQRLSQPKPEHDWMLKDHIELPGAKWRPIGLAATDDPLLAPFGGCYDVMGDQSMMLLPTPGHTPGSMSLLVRSADMPAVLFVGDLTYDLELLQRDQMPGIGDHATLKATYAKVRKLKEALPDLVVVPSHDPNAADNVAAAGARLPYADRVAPAVASTC